MSKVHFIKGAGGAMRKVCAQDLAERDAERATREVRAMHIAACITNRCEQGRRPCKTPDKCVIRTDNRFMARFMRWAGGTARVMQMRARVWWACLGKPPF